MSLRPEVLIRLTVCKVSTYGPVVSRIKSGRLSGHREAELELDPWTLEKLEQEVVNTILSSGVSLWVPSKLPVLSRKEFLAPPTSLSVHAARRLKIKDTTRIRGHR